MLPSVLRPLRLPQSLCSTCLFSRYHRVYSSQALLALSPTTHAYSQPDQNAPKAGPSAEGFRPQPGPAVVNRVGLKDAETRAKRPRKPKTDKTLLEINKPRRNPLEPNNVDLHLASLQAAGLEPTLSDINRCRPAKHGHPESPQYAQDYQELCESLLRTFSKGQLRRFGEMYGLDSKWTRSWRRKIDYAESIIEQAWKWPSLSEIEKQKMDRTQIEVKFFPVNPSQLFLILGRDGVDLLQMSMKFNVHMSLTPNPLRLRVEGSIGSLRKATLAIEELKTHIVEDTFKLSTNNPIRSDLVQRISRLAGAFIENVGDEGVIRICAKAPPQLLAAKRLAIRAAFELQEQSRTPVLTYVPLGIPSSTPIPTSMFPHTYSVYPFLSPRSLPWTMNTSGAFRIRRVGEWLSANPSEDLQKTGGLAEGRGHLLTSSEPPQNIKDTLLDVLSGSINDTNSSNIVVTASFGHFLVTSSTPGQRATIIPPLKGFWALSKILRWLQNSDMKTSFVSSLPSSLLISAPARQKMLHRLVYHAQPSISMNSARLDHVPQLTNVLTFEIVLAKPKALPETSLQDPETISELETPFVHEDLAAVQSETNKAYLPRCLQGRQSCLDIMMPDRPMDIRFSAFDLTNVASNHVPLVLQEYASHLRAFLSCEDPRALQPDPPLTLTFDETTYILNANMSVRRSIESMKPAPVHDAAHGIDEFTTSVIHAVCESILDLESNQKSSTCEITCDDFTSENSWKRFLASCDHLSAITHRPVLGTKEGYGESDDKRLYPDQHDN